MFIKKLLIGLLSLGILFGTSLYAKPDHANNGKKEKKMKKQKNLPYGLQKKINNGGTLPQG